MNAQKRSLGNNRVVAWIIGACIIVSGVYLQLKWMAGQTVESDHSRYLRFQEIPCYQCGGEGFRRDPHKPDARVFCSICFGVGNRKLLSPRDGRETCPSCVGMGRTVTGYNSGDVCETCHGWGAVGVKTWEEAEIKAYSVEDLPTTLPPPVTLTPLPPPGAP